MKNKILEISWLILAIFSILIAIIETIRVGFANCYHFYIFFIVAIFVYFLRRNHRKNHKKY